MTTKIYANINKTTLSLNSRDGGYMEFFDNEGLWRVVKFGNNKKIAHALWNMAFIDGMILTITVSVNKRKEEKVVKLGMQLNVTIK